MDTDFPESGRSFPPAMSATPDVVRRNRSFTATWYTKGISMGRPAVNVAQMGARGGFDDVLPNGNAVTI
jgi:hypothetical protein